MTPSTSPSAQDSTPPSPQDLTELLSEVYDADRMANNPRTRDFLEAGERVLHSDLVRDAGRAAATKGAAPL